MSDTATIHNITWYEHSVRGVVDYVGGIINTVVYWVKTPWRNKWDCRL